MLTQEHFDFACAVVKELATAQLLSVAVYPDQEVRYPDQEVRVRVLLDGEELSFGVSAETWKRRSAILIRDLANNLYQRRHYERST